MLTKAILTGGVLSLLAGAGVYFGTEGAETTVTKTAENIRIDDNILAGAAESPVKNMTVKEVVVEEVAVEKHPTKEAPVAEADMKTTGAEEVAVEDLATATVTAQDPPPKETSEPKTKWLDQYLKKTKPKAMSDNSKSDADDEMVAKSKVEMVKEENIKKDNMASGAKVVLPLKPKVEMAKEEDVTSHSEGKMSDEMPAADAGSSADTKMKIEERSRRRKERWTDRRAARKDGKGRHRMSKDKRVKMFEGEVDIDIEGLKEEFGIDSEKDIQVRVIRKTMGDGESFAMLDTEPKMTTDYASILTEAKKLQVVDMRNQAFLEIIDHAIDQGDVEEAADIVDELSTPELRDTARARIGTGLALRGDSDAAFAVVDEIEIDELAAPIRLEIITALMATKQERKSLGLRR